MWLPSQFYEKAPHYWLLLGLLFITVGSYLGLQVEINYLYFGVVVGLCCCLWSVRVFTARAKHRRSSLPDESAQGAEPDPELTDNA
jgi:Kef-type K+ transport system membrane component KefB